MLKTEKISSKNLTLHLKELENEGTKPEDSRGEKITNARIWGENELETRTIFFKNQCI